MNKRRRYKAKRRRAADVQLVREMTILQRVWMDACPTALARFGQLMERWTEGYPDAYVVIDAMVGLWPPSGASTD